MGCLLELLPNEILQIIHKYKQELEEHERFIRFLNYITHNLIGIRRFGGV